jgi:hypothetical protein
MMDQQIASRLRADQFLLHAPSVHDFRERDGALCACLSASAVTGAASGVARRPDRDVYRSSRPRWALHC